ncbi:MAG: beta strand repeat-containing protein, partial [Planctomycetota bacterium]
MPKLPNFRRSQKMRRRSNSSRLLLEALESRQMMATDLQVRFEFADTSGTPVTALDVGNNYLLNVFVKDVRPSAVGVSQAYFDIAYNSSLLAPAGAIVHTGTQFQAATSGSTATSGLIDEAGGSDTDQIPPPPAVVEQLLLQIPLTAQAIGTVNLTGSLANDLNHETLLFGSTSPLTAAEVQYVGGSIAINNGTILISPTSGLTTTEAGGTATATVVLSRAPTANVTFNLFSSDTTEGTVSPSSFTFTPANWNISQTLVITGVDDSIDDDNVLYFIFTDAATSSDPNFNGFNPDNLLVTNIDDEIAGLLVSPTSGLVTSETGSSATFSVVLRTVPTATVTVDLTSSDLTEGTVSPSTLTFTPANWNVAQTVTVTGVDDAIDDGDVPYSIEFAPTISTDPKYQSLSTGSVSVTNQDDPQDVAGFVISRTSGLVTTELGGTDTFTVRLATQPSANVTVPVSSSNANEALAFVVQGSSLTSSLIFTADNWNVPQTIEVTGVDDSIDDGDTAFSVILGTATSSDAKYSGLNPTDVTGINQNNPAEIAGFTVTPTVGLFTSEAGGTATFTIVLNTKPLANVTVPIVSGDQTEGTVSSSFVVFTPSDWNIPRTITVTGVDDAIDDDNVSFTVFLGAATSTDPKYNGLNPEDVTVINADDPNETAAIFVTPTVGLTTSESGTADIFQIVLATQPLSDVIISLTSSDTTEGTVSPLTITFTPDNWNVPQTVTVTGVDDFIEDGDVGYTILTAAAVSDDPKYDGIDPADVSVNNVDDVTDKAGITVTPTSGLITTEAGGKAQFTIVLNSQPLQNVTIGLSVDDETEGSLSVSSVVFTPANWNEAQTVMVTGVDDFIADGDVTYSVITAAAVSDDVKYQGLNPADVSLVNLNDATELARLIVTPSSGLVTTENGNAASFTVKLGTQPVANVTITVSSNDTSEGTANPSSLTFTPSNWNVAQFVTVVGVDDLDNDGDQNYAIVLGSASSDDPEYAALGPTNVSVTNADNENPGVIVTPTSGLVTSEAGQAANFTVVLRTPPSSPVTIPVSSSDSTEGLPAPSSLIFDSTNWNIPQLVVIAGVNDFVPDGNVAYQINLGPAVSADGAYQGFVVPSVSVTNNDDQDTAGILVTPTSGLVTTESGGTATFTVVLQSQPTADVTIALSSSDLGEGTVTPTSVTFTAANWSVAQTVTVTGVADLLDDGDVGYTIVTAAAVSTDPQYSGLNATDVSVTNQNVASTPGILVTPTSGLVTTESGGTATFTVVLQSQPTADVTIALSSSDTTEGTVAPTSVTFNAANWNVAQTVTVTGVSDTLADGDVAYTIVTAAAVSTDPQYSGLNATDVSVTNQNVASTPGILVTPTSGLVTTESGGTATFTVVLQSQPTADVTIALSSSDTTEGTVAPTSVTFTAANWNVAQTVTVTGVSDTLADGDVAYTIVTAAAVSTDPQYSGLNATDVSVTNQNVASTPGILVTPTSGLVTTESGGTATFTIVLQSQPTANVTIALSSSDTTEGTVAPTSVTFTAANWNVAQTVTVTGVSDLLADGDVGYTIVT